MATTTPKPSPTATGASPIGYDGGLTCSIQVKDINESIKFYQDILGFKLLYHLKDMGWCELATEVNRVVYRLKVRSVRGVEGVCL